MKHLKPETCHGQHDIMSCWDCAFCVAIARGIVHEDNEQIVRTIREMEREARREAEK